MRGVRLDLLAGVWCACFAGGCSLLESFDGFGGGATDTDSGLADARPADSGRADSPADAPTADSPADAPMVDSPAPTMDGPTCKNDLSNIGTGDFTIAFTLTTSQSGIIAVANQRTVCNNGMFWDVHLSNGIVQAETDDNANHHGEADTTGTLVNDGQPHSILIQRRFGALTVAVDGAPRGAANSTSAFGQLAPLRIGSSPCVGHTGYYALVGTIHDVCVTSP
jgi:hypothetical protein